MITYVKCAALKIKNSNNEKPLILGCVPFSLWNVQKLLSIFTQKEIRNIHPFFSGSMSQRELLPPTGSWQQQPIWGGHCKQWAKQAVYVFFWLSNCVLLLHWIWNWTLTLTRHVPIIMKSLHPWQEGAFTGSTSWQRGDVTQTHKRSHTTPHIVTPAYKSEARLCEPSGPSRLSANRTLLTGGCKPGKRVEKKLFKCARILLIFHAGIVIVLLTWLLVCVGLWISWYGHCFFYFTTAARIAKK